MDNIENQTSSETIIETMQNFDDWTRSYSHNEVYVREGCVKVQRWSGTGAVSITVLSNAQKKGKSCLKFSIRPHENYSEVLTMLQDGPGFDLREVLRWLAGLQYESGPYCDHRAQVGTVSIYADLKQACRVYSPFFTPKCGKTIIKQIEAGYYKKLFNVRIVTGASIWMQLDDKSAPPKEYRIGDTCEQGSYNLVYMGKVVNISEKTVETLGATKGKMRDSIAAFVDRNWDFDKERAAKRNADWMD